MTDSTHRDSGITTSSEVLAHYAEIALMYEELRAAIDGGHESMTHADALAEISAMRAENATLQLGYDAARLEIDHLRGATKMMEPAGEYPPLPEWSKMDNLGGLVPSEIRQELRAYADATCAMRAQAAPQQSEVASSSIFDGVIPAAIRSYLRKCSSGGMPKKHIDIVQINVDEAERLDYFKLAIAEAVIASRVAAPHGASATLSAAEKTGNGGGTIVA